MGCAQGFVAIALQYTLEPRRMLSGAAMGIEPALEEAVTALCILKQRMSETGVDVRNLFLIGFSSGAHLAMSLCRRIKEMRQKGSPPSLKGIVLAYPPGKNPLCDACILTAVG